MRWPLTSRTAYDAVVSERDRLRGINDTLLAQLVGLVRVTNGLREGERKRKPKDQVPAAIRKLIHGWESEASRKDMALQVATLRREGKAWTEIETILETSLST